MKFAANIFFFSQKSRPLDGQAVRYQHARRRARRLRKANSAWEAGSSIGTKTELDGNGGIGTHPPPVIASHLVGGKGPDEAFPPGVASLESRLSTSNRRSARIPMASISGTLLMDGRIWSKSNAAVRYFVFLDCVCRVLTAGRDRPDIREKIKRVIRQGHIDPEDFNGVGAPSRSETESAQMC